MIRTDKGHCWIEFSNGYTISIFNGFGSFTDNKWDQDVFKTSEFVGVDSKTCEIAIFKDDIFCTDKIIDTDDDVKGYVSADELADIIYKVKRLKGDDKNGNKDN